MLKALTEKESPVMTKGMKLLKGAQERVSGRGEYFISLSLSLKYTHTHLSLSLSVLVPVSVSKGVWAGEYQVSLPTTITAVAAENRSTYKQGVGYGKRT